MRFRFLGTGTSVGVPQIGCGCPVCTSGDPRDKRNRCGAYMVASSGEAFLIDTPPEMRLACLKYAISKVDAILLTHAHMDHVAGFDDIRRFNTINGEVVPCDPAEPGANGRSFRVIGKILPCYALPETIAQMHKIFPYIGAKAGEMGLFRPQVEFRENLEPFEIGSIKVTAFKVEHGFPCAGYLFEEGSSRLGYVSDCHKLGEDVIELLERVDALIINCLRMREHPTHLSLAQSLEYIKRIAPKKAYLIHMCHDISHQEFLDRLKGLDIEPAFDGEELVLES